MIRVFSSTLMIIASLACLLLPQLGHAQLPGTDESEYEIKIKKPWRSHSDLFHAEELLAQNNYQDAILFLDELLAANKFVADAYAYRGYAYLELGKIDAAEKDFRYALNINARHMGAYNYYGRLYIKEDDLSSAKNQLSAIRQLCGSEKCPEYKDLKYRIRKVELGTDTEEE